MSEVDMTRRARLRGAAVLLVTFLAGALTGAAVLHVARLNSAARVPGPAEAPPERVIENMKMARSGIPVTYEALDLTPAQRFQIARIMDANRPRTDSLLNQTWPKLHALLDSIQRQVERVLTPEQRAHLAALRRGGMPPSIQPNSSLNGGKNP